MKFQLIVCGVCLIFLHTILRTRVPSGITPRKKCYFATALALLITAGCKANDVYHSKQTGSSSTKGNHHLHHFFVSGIGQKKLSMQLKFVAAQKMLATETQQTFVNGLLGFITLGIYICRSACVLLTIIAWVAHRYGQLYLHCSLIYFWVPSSCFCIVISLSLRVK